MEAFWKMKEGVEAKKEEAFIKVIEEIEDKKVALMKVKEDVEEKVGHVKMFLQGRMLDPISDIKTNTIPTFSTINTAVAAATVYDSDSSDSSKGSAESLDDEKLKGKSGKRHSNKIEGTISSTYPVVNSSPVDVIVHKSHEDQIFYPQVKYSGVQERAEKNYQAEKDNIEEATEICLEKLYQKQWSHEFYCPNCKTCITKVIIHERYSEPAPPTVIPPDKEKLRCANCFCFLIPIGNWIRNILGSKNQDTLSSISYPASVNSCPVDIHQSHGEGISNSGVKYPLVQEIAVKRHQTGKDNIENKYFKDFSPSPQKIQDQNRSYTCLEKGTTSGQGKVDCLGMETAEGVAELYLEKLYQKQESHEFYCPNCNACITKVLIIRERYYPEPAPPAVIVPDKEELRCTNCFSFLVPAGNWIRNIFAAINPTGQATVSPTPKPLPLNPGNSTTGLEEPLGPHYLDKNLGDQIPGNPQTVGHIVPGRSQPSEPIIPHLGDNISPGAGENNNAVSVTISPIVYPREDDPPVDFISVHRSQGEQIFDFKDSGSEENAAKNHQDNDNVQNQDSSTDFSSSPTKPKKFIDQDENGSYSYLEKSSTKEHEKYNLTNESAEEATEIYLEKLYQKQVPHEFYCPNCMSRITKVIVRERDREPRPLPESELRCTSCVSFLIVSAGNWIMTRFTPTNQIGQVFLFCMVSNNISPITYPGVSGQTVDIVHHQPDHGEEIFYSEVKYSPSNSNKSLQDQNGAEEPTEIYLGNLYRKEGSQYDFYCPTCVASIPKVLVRKTGGRNELDGVSFIDGQMSEVKMCLKVAKKKLFHLLHLKKKAGLWDCYSVDAKTAHASDDVHTSQTKMDMFVAKVKSIAGKLPWNMKKNRNLDSCEKIDVDQNVVACHNARKTSKVFDESCLGIQEVIDEEQRLQDFEKRLSQLDHEIKIAEVTHAGDKVQDLKKRLSQLHLEINDQITDTEVAHAGLHLLQPLSC